MASACPDCGEDDFTTDFQDGRIVLLCSSCGTEVDPQVNKENESCVDKYDDDNRVSAADSVKKKSMDVQNTNFSPISKTCKNCNGGNLVEDIDSDQLVCEDCGSYTEHQHASSYYCEANPDGSMSGASQLVPETTPIHTGGTPHQNATKDTEIGANEHVVDPENIQKTVSQAKICKGCGSENLVHDIDQDKEQWVCEDCGYFTEEYALVSTQDYTTIAGSSATYGWTPAPKPRFANVSPKINKGQESGVKTIKDIAARLSWRSDLTDQAVSLFERVYPHRLVKLTANELKDALGIGCIYSVARENGEKVTLRTLMGFHSVKKKLITRALNLLKEISKKPLAAQSVSSLPEHILACTDFPSSLLDKISKLVNACEKGFVSQGRDHTNVVISVAHLAWVSEDYAQRKSVKLSKFCEQHRLPYGRQAVLVQKDVIELFIKLANQLPWVNGSVGKHNYIHYLTNIAMYCQTMVSRARSKDPATMVPMPEVPGAAPDSDSSAVRRLPSLAPPSMKKTRCPVVVEPSQLQVPAHLSAEDLECEVLKDNEFPDKEIESYILSPQEVEVKQRVMKLS